MRGHDQTNGRGRNRAWACLVLAASAALATSPPVASAQEPFAARDAEPIALSADQIRDWTIGQDHWVLLEGRAAILQGTDGVRADRAIVRIVAEPGATPNANAYSVEIVGEGRASRTDRPLQVQRECRHALRSSQGPDLRPYNIRNLFHLDGPPAEAEALVHRLAPATDLVAESPVPDEPVPVVTLGAPLPEAAATIPAEPASDPALVPTQFGGDDFGQLPTLPDLSPSPDEFDVSGTDEFDPSGEMREEGFDDPEGLAPLEGTDLEPIPDDEVVPGVPRPRDSKPTRTLPAIINPGSQRIISVYPRDGSGRFAIDQFQVEGYSVTVIRGGVNLFTRDAQRGDLDISADNAVIWRGLDKEGEAATVGPGGELVQDDRKPLEVYLEGNIVFLQDERKVAGNGDQKAYRASRAYYDFRTDTFVGLDAELDLFAPGLVAPMKVKAPRIHQFVPQAVGPGGAVEAGPKQIRADKTVSSGSRFANPGYRFNSRMVDIFQVPVPLADPRTGTPVDPDNPDPPKDLSWLVDARWNVFYLGSIPAFFWPRFLFDPDDLDPPLRNITPRFNNYFGTQLLSDWNGFKLFGIKKPTFFQVDNWNVDIDYLSRRKSLALGSEFGYFGNDLFSDIVDEFDPAKNSRGFRRSNVFPGVKGRYFGYFDFWGLNDQASDVLGTGPAVVTYGPPGAGKRGFQRYDVPSGETFRGRLLFRHMQSLLPTDADPWEDARVQAEVGYITDRHFLEQYYKRLFDIGLDQETLLYGIRQKDNTAFTALAEVNLQDFYTESQWLPKLEYFRLGDSLLGNRITHFQNTGADWANTHPAIEVNNPNIFAFLPYDPVANISSPLRTGRIWTSHELDMPLDFNVLRLTPYVQGQAIGWNNQIGGDSIGRIWGAAGLRANVMIWRTYPGVESELLNVHGLAHKVNFDADYRNAYSNVQLNRIGVQDDLDDNTYEFVRRYFALTNYAGGILPAQYDPRFLTLRRAASPITGTTDIQRSIQTLQLGIHQRLQTKRGPEGKRRVIDYMVLDLTSTYFPYASRDNFGTPWGQTLYNYEWYIGDRTSIYTNGWFEFFDINGVALLKTNPKRTNDPFGIKVINSGISIARPPRGSLIIGYSIINTGTIATSAVNVTNTYWLSPKWYGAFGTSYDFGNAVGLGSNIALTRVGADYLVTVGLTADPQRNSYMAGFEIAPRLSPNVRLGSASGLPRFDSRFAPTQ